MPEIKVGLEEKRMYRICKELEKHGESLVKTNGHKEWNGIFRKWGIVAKPLVEKEYLEPVWITYHKKCLDQRLIRLKKGITVVEKPGRNCTFFKFIKEIQP